MRVTKAQNGKCIKRPPQASKVQTEGASLTKCCSEEDKIANRQPSRIATTSNPTSSIQTPCNAHTEAGTPSLASTAWAFTFRRNRQYGETWSTTESFEICSNLSEMSKLSVLILSARHECSLTGAPLNDTLTFSFLKLSLVLLMLW